MTETIRQKHGNTRNFILNLVLLGVVGVVLIRLMAVVIYSVLPNEYFLSIDHVTVTAADACPPQVLYVTGAREIYPYLPESVQKTRALQADVTLERFKTDGRKIDDLKRTPVIEWTEGGESMTEWNFKTTLLPGSYYVVMTTYIELPVVGKRETPIRTQTNTFTVEDCIRELPKPVEPILKAK